MARLPTYTNQAGLDTGSDTFRLAPDTGAAIAQGISQFGQGLLDAGDRISKASLRLEAKTQAIEERDANLRDEAEFIRLGNQVNQFAKDYKEKVGDDAKGYTEGVEKFSQNAYSELLASGRLSSGNKAKHDLLFERTVRGEVNRAAEYEAQTKWKFQSDVFETRLKDLTALVGAGGAKSIDQAKDEWRDVVERTEGTNTRLGKKFLEFGNARIEKQAFLAEATKRGPEFMGQFQGLVSDNPSATTGNAQVDAALKYAPINGINPRTAVAIGWIESRLKMDHGKPKWPNGTPMSSAEGGWQILDGVARDFGLSIADKRDPDKATAAVMKHFAQNQARLEAAGQTVTPGKLYMYWNVGQGVAERILRADPNTPIEQIIFSAYPSRPGFALQVLRNNPSLYRAGMTAGQVMENYERQMQRATDATAKFFNGTRIQSDETTRAAASAFMGRDMQYIGTTDLVQTFADVSKNVKEATAKERDIAEGELHLSNPGFGDPHDAHRKKVINAAVENRIGDDVVQGIARGDARSLIEGRTYVDAAGFIPDKVLHGFRSALDSNSVETAMLTMQQLSAISKDNPTAYGASSLQADEKEMVRDYRAMTETMGLDPANATKQILAARTPEGKKAKQAMMDKIRAEWKNGGTDADAELAGWKEIVSKFDQPWTWSNPDTATDAHREAIVEAYRSGIAYNRMQGYTPEVAKARTIQALQNVWGVSNVASTARSQQLMPLPPEKVLAGKAINGSFDWVTEQAENFLVTYLEGTKQFSTMEFSLVPKEGSVRDYLEGRPVSYEVWYKDDKGMIQRVVAGDFTPDYADAKKKADEDFRRARDGGAPEPNAAEVQKRHAQVWKQDLTDIMAYAKTRQYTPGSRVSTNTRDVTTFRGMVDNARDDLTIPGSF